MSAEHNDADNGKSENRMRSAEEQLEYYRRILPEIREVCKETKPRKMYSFAKRLFDIIASLLLMIILSPLFLYLICRIRIESPGSAFFRQQRVGKNGKLFTMLKFRSMYCDAEDRLDEVIDLNKGPTMLMFKAENDPRETPFGRKIRRSGLDELPQLLNVLAGQMSFVGPRPPLVREVIQYERDGYIRLSVIGGLTCFWQLEGRNNADFEYCLSEDKRYIEKRNLFLDLRLIIKTALYVLHGGED